MDPIYKVDWSNDTSVPILGHQEVVSSAWSSSNLFAFTTEKISNCLLSQCLHITHPNQPWDVFSVVYKNGNITKLEWNWNGTMLLTGDSNGVCCVWKMVGNMNNHWEGKAIIELDKGEYVLALGWFHPGVYTLFQIEKLDEQHIYSKFARQKFLPSITQYGGKHLDGVVVVTATGLVAVQLLEGGEDMSSYQFSLNVPGCQEIADVTFTSEGKIVVLTSDGNIHHMIQFHEIDLKYDLEDKLLTFEVQPLPSLALKCATEEQVTYTRISHAKFLSKENCEHVLVCVSGPTGAKFESWLLKKENIKVHRVFQQLPIIPDKSSVVPKSWLFVKNSSHLPKVLDFSVPGMSNDMSSTEDKLSKESNFYSGLLFAVAFANNTVQLFHRIHLTSYESFQFDDYLSVEMGNGKRLKAVQGNFVQSVNFSTMSCAIITLDNNANMWLTPVPPWLQTTGKATPQSSKQLVQLMLYCVATGYEWWDILLHIKPDMVGSIIEQITLEMNMQPAIQQQYLKLKFLSLQITIYQLAGNSCAMDCHLRLIFDAISHIFRSLVRSQQPVTCDENDPALKLQQISNTLDELNIDQLVQNIYTDLNTLQSMQQLTQWVADITLYLLASVPISHQPNRPGMTLLRDRRWLSLLREMLVLIRVWGLLKSACSPVFTILDSEFDVLGQMFRLVTLLWQTTGNDELRQQEISKEIKNECSLLSMKVLIPPLEAIQPVNGILSHLRVQQSTKQLTFGTPQHNLYLQQGKLHQMDYVAIPGSSGIIDSLRRVFMGKNPNQELKECVRCGIVSMLNILSQSSLMFWDQRFIVSCLCGGQWHKLNSGYDSCS